MLQICWVLTAVFLSWQCAGQNETIYSNALANGWMNYSWAAVNTSCTSNLPPGAADCISVYCTNYTALYLEHSDFDSTPFTSVSFWLNGGAAGGQVLTVTGTLGGANQSLSTLPPLSANT
jgi:hypothetical protein